MFNLGWACVTKSLKYYYIGMEAEGGGGGGGCEEGLGERGRKGF